MNWYRDISATEKRTLWSCFAGWALDGVDTQLFSLVIPTLLVTWGIGKGQAGLIGGATLVAGALGGLLAGMLSDRYGRVRALQITVVWFSLFTFLSAFAQNFEQLLVLKALQGIGFGGEWTAGAVLLSETIRAEHRGKAMGIVQSAWGFGWAGAVVLYMLVFSFVSPEWAWRLLFGIGVIPAGLVLYLRRNVVEPPRVAVGAGASRQALPAASSSFDRSAQGPTRISTSPGSNRGSRSAPRKRRSKARNVSVTVPFSPGRKSIFANPLSSSSGRATLATLSCVKRKTVSWAARAPTLCTST